VIAVAPHVADGVVALGVPRANVTVITNGVDLDSLPPVPAKEPGALVTIGVLGRADPQKGMDVFARAVGMPQADGIGAQFTIGVATGGFPEYEGRVLNDARRVGIEIMTPGSNGPAFLAGLDIVVMPSRWEGSPLVLFEALALGKPVIATDIPGIAEVIASEDVGLLVPPDDPSALAEAIRTAMVDRDRRRRWSKNARRLASRYTREEATTRAARIVSDASV
jgi:glycosyltransferase involved in cell wall biosynthesis